MHEFAKFCTLHGAWNYYSSPIRLRDFSVSFPSFRILGVVVGMFSGFSAAAGDIEVIYTTRAGDTLIGLERQFLASPFGWKGLKTHNRIGSPMHMPVGASLRIPESWLRVEPRTARVVSVRGDVTMDGRPLLVDAKVPAGSVLRTGADAFVTLVMPDESRLTVQPGSEARLDKVQGFRGFDGQNTQIHLEQGRVETSVAAQRGPAARYQIRTPTAYIGVRGTEFRVGSDAASQAAQAEVTGGEVRMGATRGATATAVPAGYGLVATPGQALVPRALLPAPPIKDVPAIFERIELRFVFPPVDKAVAYRAQIARDRQFADVLMAGVFPTASARFSGLPDGAYWLRVRAVDDAGLEGFDATQAFELRARPEPPVVVALGGGTLAWQPAAEAAGYRLQLARDTAFTTLVAERDTEALSIDPALPAGNYQWRIASLRANGERGPWGEPAVLSVRKAPGAAVLTVYNGRARFAWPGEPGQIYHFQLARDAAFQDLLVEQRIGEPAVTVPLPSSGSYFMRLRATDPDGVAGPWSTVQTFRSTFFLPVWSLSSPATTTSP